MAFPFQVELAEVVNLWELATTYELSGADIMNVVQYCCLQTLKRGDTVIHQEDLQAAIKREFGKAGKIV